MNKKSQKIVDVLILKAQADKHIPRLLYTACIKVLRIALEV